MAGDFQNGIALWRNFHNATLAREGGRHVHVAYSVKSQTLRASQAAEECVYRPLRIDPVNGVKARGSRSRYKKVALRSEGEVIRRDARFQSGEHEHLLVAANLKDGPAAVADIEILIAIKGDPRGDSHALGISGHGSVRRHTVDRAVMPRRNIHLPLAVEGNLGRIHHFTHQCFHREVVITL